MVDVKQYFTNFYNWIMECGTDEEKGATTAPASKELKAASAKKSVARKNQTRDAMPTILCTNNQRSANGMQRPWCRHGLIVSLLPVFFAFYALMWSILAKHSTSFATLQEPLTPTESFLPVTHVGLYRLLVCEYNGNNFTVISGQTQNTVYTAMTKEASEGTASDGDKCTILQTQWKHITDVAWDLSRIFGAIAVLLGLTSFVFLIVATFRDEVNLSALMVTILIVYLLECMTTLFFDSKMCRNLGCRLSTGGAFEIVACAFWFACGVATLILFIRRRDDEDSELRSGPRECHTGKAVAVEAGGDSRNSGGQQTEISV